EERSAREQHPVVLETDVAGWRQQVPLVQAVQERAPERIVEEQDEHAKRRGEHPVGIESVPRAHHPSRAAKARARSRTDRALSLPSTARSSNGCTISR